MLQRKHQEALARYREKKRREAEEEAKQLALKSEAAHAKPAEEAGESKVNGTTKKSAEHTKKEQLKKVAESRATAVTKPVKPAPKKQLKAAEGRVTKTAKAVQKKPREKTGEGKVKKITEPSQPASQIVNKPAAAADSSDEDVPVNHKRKRRIIDQDNGEYLMTPTNSEPKKAAPVHETSSNEDEHSRKKQKTAGGESPTQAKGAVAVSQELTPDPTPPPISPQNTKPRGKTPLSRASKGKKRQRPDSTTEESDVAIPAIKKARINAQQSPPEEEVLSEAEKIRRAKRAASAEIARKANMAAAENPNLHYFSRRRAELLLDPTGYDDLVYDITDPRAKKLPGKAGGRRGKKSGTKDLALMSGALNPTPIDEESTHGRRFTKADKKRRSRSRSQGNRGKSNNDDEYLMSSAVTSTKKSPGRPTAPSPELIQPAWKYKQGITKSDGKKTCASEMGAGKSHADDGNPKSTDRKLSRSPKKNLPGSHDMTEMVPDKPSRDRDEPLSITAAPTDKPSPVDARARTPHEPTTPPPDTVKPIDV